MFANWTENGFTIVVVVFDWCLLCRFRPTCFSSVINPYHIVSLEKQPYISMVFKHLMYGCCSMRSIHKQGRGTMCFVLQLLLIWSVRTLFRRTVPKRTLPVSKLSSQFVSVSLNCAQHANFMTIKDASVAESFGHIRSTSRYFNGKCCMTMHWLRWRELWK